MFLNLFFDIILLTVFVGGAYFGYKKGAFRLVAGALKGVACFLLSISLTDCVANTLIAPLIRAPITNYLLDFTQKRIATLSGNNTPTLFKIANVLFNENNPTDKIISTVEGWIEFFSNPIVALISRIFAFVLIFIGLRYIIRFLIYLLDSCFNLGVIGWFNKAIGLFLSLCLGFFVCWVFCSATEYLLSLDVFASSRLVADFDGGILYRFFKEFTLLSLIFSF